MTDRECWCRDSGVTDSQWCDSGVSVTLSGRCDTDSDSGVIVVSVIDREWCDR